MGVLSFLFLSFYSIFLSFDCISFSFLLSLCTFLFRWYFVLVRVNQVMGFYKVFIIKSVKGEFIQWGMQLREMK